VSAALRDALTRWPLRPREKITFEYVLLEGENDSIDDAERLASYVGDLRHNVNVIPFNEHASSSFREPSEDGVQAFVKRLQERGCLVTVRRSRGRDVAAACGTLLTSSQRVPNRLGSRAS
jgi:23S rRNA (adenine2503-C2)-methyltransferase